MGGLDPTHKVVLIGGQAVNYWAEHYQEREPRLRNRLFTSKDIDFQAESVMVNRVARVLGVKANTPAKDHATESTGQIRLQMSDGRECNIDFLRRSIPNHSEDVTKTAVSVPFEGGFEFWVMHPFACMRSRAYNVIELSIKYGTPHAKAQLEASVLCLGYFILDTAGGNRREALDIAKKVFNYCDSDRVGAKVFRETGIDPFDAVPNDRILGADYVDQCYPRWRAHLTKKRANFKAPNHTKND